MSAIDALAEGLPSTRIIFANLLALIFVRRTITGGRALAILAQNSEARSPHMLTNTGPVKSHMITSRTQFSFCTLLFPGVPDRSGITRISRAHSVAKPAKMMRVLGKPSARASIALTKLWRSQFATRPAVVSDELGFSSPAMPSNTCQADVLAGRSGD